MICPHCKKPINPAAEMGRSRSARKTEASRRNASAPRLHVTEEQAGIMLSAYHYGNSTARNRALERGGYIINGQLTDKGRTYAERHLLTGLQEDNR